MAYSISSIITWAKIAQPLSRIGETKKKATTGKGDTDLDIKLYITRKDTEYAYAQSPTADSTFAIANYLLSLMGVYLFQAQNATGSGGQASSVVAASLGYYDFVVAVSGTPIIQGQSTFQLPSSWIGLNIILFFRGGQLQSTVNGGGTYYSWDSTNAVLTLIGGAAVASESIQIYPAL